MWQKQQVSESKQSTRMVVQARRESSWCASFELLCIISKVRSTGLCKTYSKHGDLGIASE